ncbi:MAG: DUF2065 domain-containing protein [Proteobacteria bacterium]|nr:DUF2065 domain-containing protein [Pseudomonadota bacterium]
MLILDDFIRAAALLLVFEGIMPFANPARWRELIRLVSSQSDRALRMMGLISMLMGALLLYLANKHIF